MSGFQDCPHREELLAFQEGKLPAAAQAELAGHVAACAKCQARLTELAPDATKTQRLANASTGPSSLAAATNTAASSPPEAHPGTAAGPTPTLSLSQGGTEYQGLGTKPAGAPPRQLREYELLDQLGEGGMGTVYRARHVHLDKLVALKVLPAQSGSDPGAVARFQREMRAVGKLDHPHIVRAMDAGEVAGTYFLVMELVEGLDLIALLQKQGPLPVADACELIRQAAVGLAHAHAHGLIHRDVKPSNLLLTRTGVVKLLDLGLAFFPADQAGGPNDRTAKGVLMGSFDYIAPEQGEDAHTVDHRADLYSLGCTLFHLLTGQPPFPPPRYVSAVQKLRAHVFALPTPVRASRPEIPEALAVLVERLLAKEPAGRPASATEVAEALAPFAAGSDLPGLIARALGQPRLEGNPSSGVRPQPGFPSPPIPSPQLPAPTRRWPWLIAGLVLLVAAVGIAGVAILGARPDRGTLEIDTVDDQVEVHVEKDGELVKTLNLQTGWLLELRPGKYQLKLGKGGEGLKLDPEEVNLERAKKTTVHISRPPPKAPTERWAVLHGADLAGYQTWLARLKGWGFRPVFVSACEREGKPLFCAIALKEGRQVPWEANQELDEHAYQRAFDSLGRDGYRPVSITGYLSGGQLRFASLWKRGGPPGGWQAGHNLSTRAFLERLKTWGAEQMRPFHIQEFALEEEARYMILAEPDQGSPALFGHDLTAADYAKLLKEGTEKGYRPVSLSACELQGQVGFVLIMIRDNRAVPWKTRHDLTPADFVKEHAALTARGYRPLVLSPYMDGKTLRYAAIWVKDAFAAVSLPRSGKAVPELAAFDEAMRQFMSQRHIRAGALAVRKDGRLVLAYGYGFADREEKRTVQPETSFRLASVTKPFTAALVRKLCREGRLKPEAPVYDLLGLAPPPGKNLDTRWRNVTVRHLLDHKGGWDREKAFDPMIRSLEIARSLGRPGPAGPADVIRYMAGQPLQFAPGSRSSYSNFGYCLLGRVVEKVTGTTYFDVLDREILAPLGLKSIALGRTLPRNRSPAEPCYIDPERGPNVVEPDRKELVVLPDGNFSLEAMDAHGGLIGSAPDVARFMDAYDINGEPAREKHRAGCFFGSLPGTWTMALWRADGVRVVALFNQMRDPSGLDYDKIQELMDTAATRVKHWPGAAGNES